MYLRHTTRRKNGKAHRYWQLVRSVRVGRKVVQQTVAHLGELDVQGRARARALARAITGDREQSDLFIGEEADELIPVRLKRIRLERGRTFGDVWLGWTLWRALKLDEVLTRWLPEGREAVPWATMAAVLVLARLCEPSSELHIAETWYRGTALEDLFALPTPRVNDDRLYRALDRLLIHKDALQQHLVARLGELLALDYDLLLYDVTSVYFEGLAEGNPLAQRGHSRDHRADCKQVCLALVVSREGMPIGDEVFAGNRTDVTTVEDIVEAMEARYGLAQRIWVMDRGMTSEDNLEWLRETGRRYLVGTPKSELKKWAGPLADARDWQTVRDGLEAKRCVRPDGVETFVLIRSVERREKERAMHERFARRIEAGLERLGRRVRQARRPLDVRRLERQLGRLLERNQLGIRPVWHQRADRVQAHILVCFLAYVLWKTLEQWQRRAGLGQSPRTIFDELRRIQSTDIVLPTEDGRELRLRCVVRPDAAQAALLDRLGLDLPHRLRVPPPVTQIAEV